MPYLKNKAYWISPRGVISPAHDKHIHEVINSPEKFGLTKSYIQEVYNKHGERLMTEGNSREEIMLKLLVDGWIRFRVNERSLAWTVQIQKWDSKTKDHVWDWCLAVTDGTLDSLSPHSELIVLDTAGYIIAKHTIGEFVKGAAYTSSGLRVHRVSYEDFRSSDNNFETEELYASGLSRLWSKTADSDCGIITAFRSENTYKQNMDLNKQLKTILKSKGYDVTPVLGAWIENQGTADAVEVSEKSFWVYDVNKTGVLKDDLINLGSQFNQESAVFIPEGETRSELIGTRGGEKSYPGLGAVEHYKSRVFGDIKGPYYTKVRNRPITYYNKIKEEES